MLNAMRAIMPQEDAIWQKRGCLKIGTAAKCSGFVNSMKTVDRDCLKIGAGDGDFEALVKRWRRIAFALVDALLPLTKCA